MTNPKLRYSGECVEVCRLLEMHQCGYNDAPPYKTKRVSRVVLIALDFIHQALFLDASNQRQKINELQDYVTHYVGKASLESKRVLIE